MGRKRKKSRIPGTPRLPRQSQSGTSKQTYLGFSAEELVDGDKIIKFFRGDDPIPYFVGPITSVTEEVGSANFRAEGPAVVLLGNPLPWALPFAELISNVEGFEFWWKQLDFAFGLRDPRSFMSLERELTAEDLNVLKRYTQTAADLAESSALNSVDRGFMVRKDDSTGAEHVKTAFGPKDSHAGLSILLRHCDSTASKDGARFARVTEILIDGASRVQEPAQQIDPTATVERWREAVTTLHRQSLDQCVRDRLVAERGWKVYDYREHHRPDYLLRVYDYGDLLHWGHQTDELAKLEEDEMLAAYNRHSFLEAMVGLAHLYIGFGELVRAAMGSAPPSH